MSIFIEKSLNSYCFSKKKAPRNEKCSIYYRRSLIFVHEHFGFSKYFFHFIFSVNSVVLGRSTRKNRKTSHVPCSAFRSFLVHFFQKNLRWARGTPFSTSAPHFSVKLSLTKRPREPDSKNFPTGSPRLSKTRYFPTGSPRL